MDLNKRPGKLLINLKINKNKGICYISILCPGDIQLVAIGPHLAHLKDFG